MSAPAGWYNDGAGAIRYWNGSAWTSHTAAQHAMPPTPSPRPQPMPVAQPYAPYPPAQSVVPQRPMPVMTPYGAVPVAPRQSNGVGIAGFIVGLVSVFLPLFFGVAVALVGLILSIVGLTRPYAGKGLAIAGLVLSIIGLVLIF
ncbi:DUF2510 domain-containing protein [Microbacterium sp. KR10-403]|uniref:DUF2510 domain-containing protein n=1 Tax=Microbacterium sp. KR10-403 TaxID=3158581 RepID=UPI0032E3CACD